MKWIALLVLFLFAADSSAAQPLAFTDVTVIDVAAGVAEPGRTVVVADDRIVAVGGADEVDVPRDAVVVNGSGKFLIPGLWDMHVHSSTDRITREIVFPLYIAHGVTGVRDLNGDCFEPCSPLQNSIGTVNRWREDIAAGRLVGPRIVASGPIIHGPGPGEPSSVQAPATEEHGRALARLLAERGVDMIKVYDELPGEAFHGLIDEGKTLGLPVVGHVPLEVPVSEAARAGMRSIEHLYGVVDECSSTEAEQRPEVVAALRRGDIDAVMANMLTSARNFSRAKCATLYADLAGREIWQVPTLVAATSADAIGWRQHPGMRYLPRVELEFWMRSLGDMAFGAGGFSIWPYLQYRVELISVDMYRAGVPLLAGSDALSPGVFPGFGLHEELERLVKAGLTPAEALRAATLEPARYLEASDLQGTVQEGRVADLVLLGANPLEDIANTRRIETVVARGRLFDREALDALLAAAEHAARE